MGRSRGRLAIYLAKGFPRGCVCGVRCCGYGDPRNDLKHLQALAVCRWAMSIAKGWVTRSCHVTPQAAPRDKIYEIFMLFVCLTFAVIIQIDISMMPWKRVRECDKSSASSQLAQMRAFNRRTPDFRHICIICRFKHTATRQRDFLITLRAYRSIFVLCLRSALRIRCFRRRRAKECHTWWDFFSFFSPVRYTLP